MIEFPFTFLAKAPAKASEVMANLNVLKAALNGGLSVVNFGEGAFPRILNWAGGDKGAAAEGASLLDEGEVEFTLAEKSKVVFLYNLDASVATISNGEKNTYVGANLWVDGTMLGTVKTGVESHIFFEPGKSGVAVTNGGLARSAAVTLAAGKHRMSLIAVHSMATNYHYYGTSVTAIIVPTT